ncbi:hypothetical protein BJ878DRAFT_511865, partial [Calycina marina]
VYTGGLSSMECVIGRVLILIHDPDCTYFSWSSNPVSYRRLTVRYLTLLELSFCMLCPQLIVLKCPTGRIFEELNVARNNRPMEIRMIMMMMMMMMISIFVL